MTDDCGCAFLIPIPNSRITVLSPPPSSTPFLSPDGRVLHLGERPLVMGILNVTPDSFAEAASAHRSGRPPSTRRCGWRRTAPISSTSAASRRGPAPSRCPRPRKRGACCRSCGGCAAASACPISIDTYKAEVAEAALAEGAVIVNDVSGLRYEPALAAVVAQDGAALVLMHTRGRSQDDVRGGGLRRCRDARWPASLRTSVGGRGRGGRRRANG